MRKVLMMRVLAFLVTVALVAGGYVCLPAAGVGASGLGGGADPGLTDSLLGAGSDSGTAAAVYDAAGFFGIDKDGSYYLESDLTLVGSWGEGEVFAGEIDGRGYTVTLIGAPMFEVFAGVLKNIRIEGYVGLESCAYPGDAGPAACAVTGGASFINVVSNASVTVTGNGGGLAGACVSEYAKIIFEDCVYGGRISAGLGGEGYAGGMAGYCGGEVMAGFLNCASSGVVSGESGAGGICGYAAGIGAYALSCENTGAVFSSGDAGGIIAVGDQNFIYIKDSANGGDISSVRGAAGGMIAYHAGGCTFLEDCRNSARISAADGYAGGTAGLCRGGVFISDCHNGGEVTSSCAAGSYAGGIIGGAMSLEGDPGYIRLIEYCDNSGEVIASGSGEYGAGGIAGYMDDGPGSGLYGNLNRADITSPGGRAGGICALSPGGELSVKYNCNAGELFPGAGTACQLISSPLPLSFIGDNYTLEGGAPAAVYIPAEGTPVTSETGGFTFSRAELEDGSLASRLNSRAAGGSGLQGDRADAMSACYGILYQCLGQDAYPSTDRSRGVVYYYNGSCTNRAPEGFSPDLAAGSAAEYAEAAGIINSVARFTGKLTISADLAALPPSLIGRFCGTLEGGGHEITITGPLFGQLCGTVSDLTLTGTVVGAAESDAVGALAASAFGFVEVNNVSCSAAVRADGIAGVCAGGLVGELEAGCAVFSDCSFSGEVTGSDISGGIAGVSRQAVAAFSGCVNSGAVSAASGGGILGAGSPGGRGSSLFFGCANTGNISGSEFAGGISAEVTGTAVLDGCVCGAVGVSSASGSAGGLLGFAAGPEGEGNYRRRVIYDCENSACVTGATAGGLVAKLAAGAAIRCSENGGEIVSTGTAGISGGIAGVAEKGASAIYGCTNRGDLTSVRQCGGIVGHIHAKAARCDISGCFNYGDIDAGYYSGGIAGHCQAETHISRSGNYGNVDTAGSAAGGVVGCATATVSAEYCFNAGGRVSNRSASDKTYASGIIGYCNTASVKVIGCYVCGDLSGINIYAVLYNNVNESGSVTGNFYVEGCAEYVTGQRDSEPTSLSEAYTFTFPELASGALAYRMNFEAGSEVFFQRLGGSEADAYPTTDPSRGSVLPVSQSADGEPGYGNREFGTVMLGGASVRLSSPSGLRFTSYVPGESVEEALLLSKNGTEPVYGTLILPSDYLYDLGVEEVTISELSRVGLREYNFANPAGNDPSGLYYINIPADRGCVPGEDGGIYVNAALVDLKPGSFNRRFSAVSYIKYASGGEDYYVFSNYNPEQNSRSIELVASRALTDVSCVCDEGNGYVYPLAGGGFSRYSPEARSFLEDYLTEYTVTVETEAGFSIEGANFTLDTSGERMVGKAEFGSLLEFSVAVFGAGVEPRVYVNGVEVAKTPSGGYRVAVSGNTLICVRR